jgi:glycine hydroxymethyltransferase
MDMRISKELKEFDPKIAEAVEQEERRRKSTITLIASESFANPLISAQEGSVFANKLSEGYPELRYQAGCEFTDVIEKLAINRAKELFGADHANVQPYSATIANLAVYFATLKPGDTVLAMQYSHGGHITHGVSSNIAARDYKFVHYRVNIETGRINYDLVETLATKHRPKMIICGATAYPREIDFALFRTIADKVGALLLADIAHIAGLVAAGIHQSPVSYADFVTTSTHKTFRGPRGGGVILCKKEYADQIDRAVSPGLQDAPKMDMIAARAMLFKEAMSSTYKKYQTQVVANAKALAARLRENGFRLVSGGTGTHLLLLDLREKNITGDRAENVLSSVGIISNRNVIPDDPRIPKGSSGLRLGSCSPTTRGMKEPEMKQIADLVTTAIDHHQNERTLSEVRKKIRKLAREFLPLFSSEWSHKT